ncbi:5-(carboxyamino)imidazole ribonucleotide synthase [Acidisoma cellulosilytica]|uniref:N5-carboxyaminoimidazole ribonucleotide synthase n=1 Tax=Acidisoma cellulosilyticum TaxID=2802395 RepID=A0A964E3T4_9PROT|nr:5-(carboxyamino)imidazole ribonucleotide synthase [Acidisoma cellulosilyticum]MCB8880980.1 5-(carboxyamino)imidazole ribonucleotide synthase [Acidisoma cellulosilyticum]
MTLTLRPGSTIGIVGGGQLGRMLAMAAARLGYRAHILTQEADGPAAQVSAGITLGGYDDPAALRAFAAAVDVVTFEFENVSAEGLSLLADLKPVHPSPKILGISQDRVQEKTFLNGAGIATAPWAEVTDAASLEAAIAAIGLPAILKTSRLGYDGRGQARVSTPEEALAAFHHLEPKPLVLEGLVNFACEVSVIVARGADGQMASFDTVENQHKNGILDLTFAPARITEDAAAGAQALARRVAEALDLVGLLAVEMFVDRDGSLRVNEIAPRPHNSGHWTMDACPASQFALHIRAVAGLPLPEARRHSDAVMKNLIGPDDMALWPRIVAADGLIPHHYGKAEARAGRKMGHVNRLFPKGSLPGPFGIDAALGPLAEVSTQQD